MRTILFILSCSAILLINSCKDPDCRDAPARYIFELPVSLTPERDTFRVGDTITVSSIFDNMVLNREDGKRYLLHNYNFLPASVLSKIDQPKASSTFSYVEVIVDTVFNYQVVQIDDVSSGMIGDYTYDGNSYSLMYKLVLKEVGVFTLSQTSTFSFNRTLFEQQDFPGRCDRKEISLAMKVNEGTDNNIHLLNESSDPSVLITLEHPQTDYYDFGAYTFVVIE